MHLAQGQVAWFLISVESFANVQTNQIRQQIHLGHSYKICRPGTLHLLNLLHNNLKQWITGILKFTSMKSRALGLQTFL